MTYAFDNPGRLATHRSGVGVLKGNARAASHHHSPNLQRPTPETAGAFAFLAPSDPFRVRAADPFPRS